jgi:hypothetical protein
MMGPMETKKMFGGGGGGGGESGGSRQKNFGNKFENKSLIAYQIPNMQTTGIHFA